MVSREDRADPVSAGGVAADLEALAEISAGGPGVTRLAWSPELFEAYGWLRDQLEELGLEVEIDAAGNLIGRWSVGDGPAVVVGSHLDTVPEGGRFDGALGVVAGLHAIRMLRERGVTPGRPIWLVSFMDEEGPRFGTGLFGSRAFVGEPLDDLLDRRDAEGSTLAEAMRAAGHDPARIAEAAAISAVGAYLELHIEQGPVLETSGAEIGVVKSICGLVQLGVRLTGEANHAGTTPMEGRRDALVAAARTVAAVREIGLEIPDAVATVGVVNVSPGAYNVIPGEVTLTIDFRAADAATVAATESALRSELARIAAEEDVACEIEDRHRLDPVPMDPRLVERIDEAARLEGASAHRMASGAGHDAMVLGKHVPSAMLFAPSRDGLSHNPAEFTAPDDCERAARVLARALELVATDPEF